MAEETEEREPEAGADAGEGSAAQKAEQDKKESDEAKEEMRALEDDPPDKLEDWPGGKAKYETFGGASEDKGYEEGPTAKLGPSGLRRYEDGSITIDGEEVDNPEDYKGEPIPGGPTDPDAPPQPGEKVEDSEDSSDSSDSSDSKDS